MRKKYVLSEFKEINEISIYKNVDPKSLFCVVAYTNSKEKLKQYVKKHYKGIKKAPKLYVNQQTYYKYKTKIKWSRK